ncbi:MAG: cyclic nucleotide-binding domain-containing protein [Elusimicrobia bacterium]|nr:cyclic nucleotide-binding domain-containing protein [Elusimicrobiota bacterium]
MEKRLAIRPAALEWLGEALKLREVLDDKSALEQTLESFPAITLEAWPAGVEILREGEKGDDFFVVYSGRLSVWRKKDAGRARKLGVLKPGDFFGEIGFLLKAVRSATVRAEVDCAVFRVPASELSILLRKHLSLRKWVKRVACKRLVKMFLGQ